MNQHIEKEVQKAQQQAQQQPPPQQQNAGMAALAAMQQQNRQRARMGINEKKEAARNVGEARKAYYDMMRDRRLQQARLTDAPNIPGSKINDAGLYIDPVTGYPYPNQDPVHTVNRPLGAFSGQNRLIGR